MTLSGHQLIADPRVAVQGGEGGFQHGNPPRFCRTRLADRQYPACPVDVVAVEAYGFPDPRRWRPAARSGLVVAAGIGWRSRRACAINTAMSSGL